ncbi:MAG: DUF433 domain-containing protein [Chloroflexi bacterium]|nr:DUF433 domain-containing protein [Chloroflexota bacterium]
MSFDWHAYITTDPDRRSGQPTIRNMRITVQDVFAQLAVGSPEQLLIDFPELTPDDIRACYAWVADNVGHFSAAA